VILAFLAFLVSLVRWWYQRERAWWRRVQLDQCSAWLAGRGVVVAAASSRLTSGTVSGIIPGSGGRGWSGLTGGGAWVSVRSRSWAAVMAQMATSEMPGGPWTLHQLRHSALTHAAEEGATTSTLLAYSGHTSVRSLARYARVSAEAAAGRRSATRADAGRNTRAQLSAPSSSWPATRAEPLLSGQFAARNRRLT